MRFQKNEELLLLFIDPKNPLWERLTGHEVVAQSTINEIVGISPNSVQNWRKGGNIASADRVFDNANANILDGLETLINRKKIPAKKVPRKDEELIIMADVVMQYKSLYHKQSSSVQDAAEVLSMEIDDCRRIIDEILFARLPLFPEMFYFADGGKASSNIEADFKKFGGAYEAWFQRGERWLLAAIRVRYVVKIGEGLLIRCKMHFPYINRPKEYWEYDGFIVIRGVSIFWLFEQRNEPQNDYIFIVTSNAMDFETNLTMVGSYLTIGQGWIREIVSGEVLIKRAESADQIKMDDLMKSIPRDITEKETIATIQKLITRVKLERQRSDGSINTT